MRYRVYSGRRGARTIAPQERDGKPFTEFAAADDALAWAELLRRNGRVALLVVGDDSTQRSQQEIASALKSTG
jgi:hypothetical protein